MQNLFKLCLTSIIEKITEESKINIHYQAFDNYKTGYLHTLKDPNFQNELELKLKNITEKIPLDEKKRREWYSIESPNPSLDSFSIAGFQNEINGNRKSGNNNKNFWVSNFKIIYFSLKATDLIEICRIVLSVQRMIHLMKRRN